MSNLTLVVITIVAILILTCLTFYWLLDDKENACFYVTIEMLLIGIIMIVFVICYH